MREGGHAPGDGRRMAVVDKSWTGQERERPAPFKYDTRPEKGMFFSSR